MSLLDDLLNNMKQGPQVQPDLPMQPPIGGQPLPVSLPAMLQQQQTPPQPERPKEEDDDADLESTSMTILRGMLNGSSKTGEMPSVAEFDRKYRQSISPAREILANMMFGLSSSMTGTKFLSVRERKYNDWLTEQQAKMEQAKERQAQMQHAAQLAFTVIQQRRSEQMKAAVEQIKAMQAQQKQQWDEAKFGAQQNMEEKKLAGTEAARAETSRHNQQLEKPNSAVELATIAADPTKPQADRDTAKAALAILEKHTLASRPVVNNNILGASADDPKIIAQAIIAGHQPPDMRGMYRMQVPVRAELERHGFDLVTAQNDWNAIQKHLSTLNGAQQERLRQAVTFTYDSLDQVERLYNDWQQVGRASGIKMFNRGALTAAKNLPGKAGAIAHDLDAAIADLTSELGTVYKGGNASTDESLKLAAENLKSNWNEETFTRNMKRVRESLQYRKNSILNSQPVGVSENSPYTPAGMRGEPQPTHRFNPATGKIEVIK